MTPEQQAAWQAASATTIAAAREALAKPAPSQFELGQMADRIAELEWHLGSLLSVLDQAAR